MASEGASRLFRICQASEPLAAVTSSWPDLARITSSMRRMSRSSSAIRIFTGFASQTFPIERAEEGGDPRDLQLEGVADRGRFADLAGPAHGLELSGQRERLLGAKDPQRAPQTVGQLERLLIVAASDRRRQGRHPLCQIFLECVD